ncbi:MAG TPA: M43 family zinc metalloprotease, partial [Segetibacter sp.]
MIFRVLFILFLCFTSASLFSQQQKLSSKNSLPVPSSSTQYQLNTLDVLANKRSRADEDKMNLEISNYRKKDNEIITIPVVFHIVNQNPSSIPDQVLIDALQDLNDGFSKAGNYSASAGADTKIRFCLAKKDPDGGITSGITRTTSFFSNSLNPVIDDARLKNLIQWDPSRYINVWYIKSMELEMFPQFYCGTWTRVKKGGYATMPPLAGALDGIVVTDFKVMLIHEMGHYLGLYHTFEGPGCLNNDCTVDGDKVCDTPPDAAIYSAPSCGTPINSCSSDTLSGFTVDMPDQIANFMDYGNESCQNLFTQGQADRMRAAIATQRPGLLQDQCAPPCTENITASFTRNNIYPLQGDAVSFTNTSSGAGKYEWLINDAVVSTSSNFTNTFSAVGKYKVTLKAFNSSICFSTFTQYVIVNCGVTARFYTDKIVVASKSPIYSDSVRFFNTSENATSFQWLMSSDKGMAEQVISTSANFTYLFTTPANYIVKLMATNGSCTDITIDYAITVLDPTPDGHVYLNNAQCVQNTKVTFSMYACNSGYATIPAKTPITFYDADPRTAGAKKIETFYLPEAIPGNCCSNFLTYTLDIGRRNLNTLFAVFSDDGSKVPISLPNTSLVETDYINNVAAISNVAFRNTAAPAQAILEWGDTLQLNAAAGPGVVSSYVWSTAKDLSCTTCQSPILIADSSTVKSVVATSSRGCTDTAYVDIKVPPYNDYRVLFNDVQCAGKDSLYVNFTVFNDFKRAVLPATLSVSFYSGNPATGNAVLLQPVFSLPDTIKAKQFTFNTFIKGVSEGNIYAVVNDVGKVLPIAFPNNKLLEKNYTNNIAITPYKPETVLIQPSDTTVFRKQFVPLKINTTIYNPTSTTW